MMGHAGNGPLTWINGTARSSFLARGLGQHQPGEVGLQIHALVRPEERPENRQQDLERKRLASRARTSAAISFTPGRSTGCSTVFGSMNSKARAATASVACS